MPYDVISPTQTRILTVRLAKPRQHRAFQTAVEFIAGEISGELIKHLMNDWFFLVQGSEELIAGRIGAEGRNVSQLMLDAGALETRYVSYGDVEQVWRDQGIQKDFLRDKNAIGAKPPGVVGDSVKIGDKTYQLDWQLTISGIHRAWELFPQDAGMLPWAGIRVAHIDTGVTPHPALGFQGDVSSYVKTSLGKNFFADYLEQNPGPISGRPPESAGPFDNLSGAFGGHGTRTLAALAGFYDVPTDAVPPYWGAAPGVEVIPYRVTDSVIIDHVQQQIADAIDAAIGQGCRVISMSMGGIVPWHVLADAIDRAYEAGVIVCAAAGNVISEVTYPGRYNRTLTLGGASPDDVGKNFRPWANGSRGPFVDVCGPADGIRRASVMERRGTRKYFISGGGDGTSYATAICAGIAAMWLARHGGALDGYPEKWMVPAAFKRLIKETAIQPAEIKPGKPVWDTANWGRGLYQADKLLAASLPLAGVLHHEAKAAMPFDDKA